MLLKNLAATRWSIFALAIALFIPQTITIAWRWKRLVAPFAPLPLADSVRMVLAGSTMNLVLPGKMGDLTKGWFLAKAGAVSTPLGLGVVVFEKMLDVAALAVIMLAGVTVILLTLAAALPPAFLPSATAQGLSTHAAALPLSLGSLLLAGGLGLAAIAGVTILYFVPLRKLPGMAWLITKSESDIRWAKLQRMIKGSHATMDALRARGAKRGEILALSALIWALHLSQIYLFFLCLGTPPPVGEYLAMVPLAIFIGLLPISIAGFGTRDAALIALLPSLPATTVLAASIYINLRYIVPAIAGIPYLTRYAIKNKPVDS